MRPLDEVKQLMKQATEAMVKCDTTMTVNNLLAATVLFMAVLDGSMCCRCGGDRDSHRKPGAKCMFFTPVRYPIEEYNAHDD